MNQNKQSISNKDCIPNDFYDKFLCAYQRNISNILSKLRISRRRIHKLINENKDLQQDNNYFQEEIIRLEKEDDKVRSLLSEKDKKLKYIDNYSGIYCFDYRIKYFQIEDGIFTTELFSDWYSSEEEALKSINNIFNLSRFIIEKRYIKRDWSEEVSSDDE